MWFILMTIIAGIIMWMTVDYFRKDNLHNFSKNSVPLLKVSFISFMTSEQIFKLTRDVFKKYRKSYNAKFYTILYYNIVNATDAEMVLKTSKYIEKGLMYTALRPHITDGILISKREKWTARRRLVTPAFHFGILNDFFKVFTDRAEELVATLKAKVGEDLAMIETFQKFTLSTFCETAMGIKLSDLGNDGADYIRHHELFVQSVPGRIKKPWLLPDFIFSLLGHRRKVDAILKPVFDFTEKIVQHRKLSFVPRTKIDGEKNVYLRSKQQRFAFLDTLLQAHSEGLIDDVELMEECNNMISAGFATSAVALTYTTFLLAHNPEAQEKVYQEIHDILIDTGSDRLTTRDLAKLDYLERVIKESLRIYPPTPLISRQLEDNLTINGFTYPKGTVCNIHIYDIHRDPEVFPDPEKFDPDRFLAQHCKNRSNFAFIPFSAGMRNCLGIKFAMMEMKVLLAQLIYNFRISPVSRREDVNFLANPNLDAQHPIKISFSLRN